MAIIHYLNVNEGDCSIIQHNTGHVSVIDVCNARLETPQSAALSYLLHQLRGENEVGASNQKHYPVNPITYMENQGINSVFRFVLTNPDMDHMDGIKDLFEKFQPTNFWDTENNAEKEFDENSQFRTEDWEFYKSIRDDDSKENPKRLVLYSGNGGKYWNQDEIGKAGGDGITILAPTHSLVQTANGNGDYNDCSYVLLYRVHGWRVVFSGDSHDMTWEHILKNYSDELKNIDLLIAPHHGRDSGRNYEFLDVLKPRLTFFGNARSKHLAYSAWNYRNLPYITNNQAGSMIVEAKKEALALYVTYKPFAEKLNRYTFFDERLKAYYCSEFASTPNSSGALMGR